MSNPLLHFLAQFPPTPTPFPAGAPAPIVLPDNLGVWESAPVLINLWNMFSGIGYAVQIITILSIVVSVGFLLIQRIRTLDPDDRYNVRRRIDVNVRQIFSPIYRRRRR